MLCLDPSGRPDLSGDAQGAEFVTRDRDGDTSAVRHGALVSPHRLAWPRSSKAISILIPADALCTLLSCGVIPGWEVTCPQLHENINVTSAQR